jgi:hypothetical protein
MVQKTFNLIIFYMYIYNSLYILSIMSAREGTIALYQTAKF